MNVRVPHAAHHTACLTAVNVLVQLALADTKKGHKPTPLYAAVDMGFTSIAKVGAAVKQPL